MVTETAVPESAPDTTIRHSPAWGLLVTLLLGLPLISPLMRWSAVACTHDGHLHYHRIAAMGQAWSNGVYFSRWLPDLAFGYGYPFFIYREAAPLYLPFVAHLAGLPLPAASNLFYSLTILAAGAFMFLWVRDLFGERAAVVSAVAYMAAPYILVDTLIRGNSPESLALPLFPLLLWAGRRWVLFGTGGSFLTAVLGLAFLSLSHNISTLIFAPTLLVYLVAIALVRTDRRPVGTSEWRSLLGRPLIRIVLMFVLGLGIAFFYTGGALLELDQVTLEQSTTTRNNDWRFNFASLGEILAPVTPDDPTLVNTPLLFRLGWVPLGLALLGTTGLLWLNGGDPAGRERRLHVGLMIAGAIVFILMALPISRPLWNTLPLIDFVQFPWRFVGRAALPIAFLAGVPFAHPLFDSGRRWLKLAAPLAVALAVALLILETLPNLYPRICTEDGFPTIQTVLTYEHVTGLVGVDPEGSYFPRTVEERPSGSPLEYDYTNGSIPQRFDESALPGGATIDEVSYDPLSVVLQINTPESFRARYLSFDFPGWTARVDGQKIPIIPEDPSGLITFDIPAGTHDISVQWQATPQRWALTILSLLALGATAALALWLWRHPGTRPPFITSLGRTELAILVATALLLLAFKLAVVDRIDTPWRRPSLPPVTTATSLQAGELQLSGSTSQETVASGGMFDIDLAWRAVAPPMANYQSRVWLEGPDGLVWSEKGTERPRIYEDAAPTRLWHSGEWGWDSQEVKVLSGTPPGDYDIMVTLFDKATLQPLALRDETTGEMVGPTAVIGSLEIVAKDRPAEFEPQTPLIQDIDSLGLRLLGVNQDRETAAPGELMLLTLFWEHLDGPTGDSFRLTLRDSDRQAAESWELPVTRDDYSPEFWPDGGRVRGQYLLHLPAGLESDDYTFLLEDAVELGPLQVTAPIRVMEQPPLAEALEIDFLSAEESKIATLTGIGSSDNSLPACGTQQRGVAACQITLVWQARTETPISYHVFVHLVDQAGNLLSQSDAVAAGWTRPTTGWLPGEYIVDTHTLALPPELPAGDLIWRVGLYNPDTGQRLISEQGDFAVVRP